MQYFSTRDTSRRVSASRAIADGLSPDGGLYVPSEFPQVSEAKLASLLKMDYRARAAYIMGLYLDEFSAEEIDALTSAAYGDQFRNKDIAPLRILDDDTAVLELWHGPTCAFKDMALQMLPHLLTASLAKCGETRDVCILTATSGDTGKAALEGFCDVPRTRIVVFYPVDGVSRIQKLQMTTQKGGNVLVSGVEGNFDDAQSGVKAIFGDKALAERLNEKGVFLSSANSMNWGRLLPQVVYYFSAYCDFVNAGKIRLGDILDFCVPTGNFGDILAGWIAGQMGLPVGRYLCASNANNVLTDFIQTGVYDRNRPFHTTISPSMDILISSNLERLLYFLSGSETEVCGYMKALAECGRYSVSERVNAGIKKDFLGGFCDDEQTKQTIEHYFRKYSYLADTHTAVALHVLQETRREEGEKHPCIVLSTASPYKFAGDVLAALGGRAEAEAALDALSETTGTPVPDPLAGIAEKPIRFNGCVRQEEMLALVEQYLS